jgi:outer membrane protein assembly factor BamA
VSGRCIPGVVDDVQVPGFTRGTQLARLGGALRIDSRDNWYQPAAGAVLDVGFDWTHGLAFDESQYVRARGSLVGVLDLWQRSRTLLVKVATQILVPIGTYPVPFSELIVLGGPDDFRGFRPGRFRNFSSLLLALEYRWPIWMWMDASVFAEYAGVFGRGFSGFGLGRMRPDVGAGVRLRSSSDFYVRAQFAYGWGDGVQFMLSFNAGL